MTSFILIGFGTGVGLLLLVRGLSPSRTALATQMGRHGPATAFSTGMAGDDSDQHRQSPLVTIGESLSAAIAHVRSGTTTIEQDLAICDRSPDQHAVTTALAAAGGVIGAIGVATATSALGADLPVAAVIGLTILGGVAGAAAPTGELRRSARRRREAFVRALSCWLELVALAQAAGMGIESALDAASRISSDVAFRLIRTSLQRARHAGTTPWEGIGRLGVLLGLDELGELAASLGLAGTEGARIRSSLRAKSASLRLRQMAEAEARSNSTTERLFLPSIVLMLALLVFLMYPAGVSLTHSL